MKVYILSFHDGSGIIGVFKTEQAAEREAAQMSGFLTVVEEYEVQE